MFEKAKPPVVPSMQCASAPDVSHLDRFVDRSGNVSDPVEVLPLRPIEWSDLTARLSAARDLRQLLREDVGNKLRVENQGFANAAAQFFRACEEDERGVNPNALEARKTSSVTPLNVKRAGPNEDLFANEKCSDKSQEMRIEPSFTREEQ